MSYIKQEASAFVNNTPSNATAITIVDVHREIQRLCKLLAKSQSLSPKLAKRLRKRKLRFVALSVAYFNRSRQHGPTARRTANIADRQARIIKKEQELQRTANFRSSRPIFE